VNDGPATPNPSDRRSERRLRVRLPVGVRGTDRNGAPFEEKTFSEDLCRGGMAFVLSRPIEPGVDLEIHLPLPSPGAKNGQSDFATRGQVRHVQATQSGCVVGVLFVGPRLHRLFLSESALPS
jgi:PilZ domain